MYPSAAWVGLINTAQLSAAHPASGDGWEMNAIAAARAAAVSLGIPLYRFLGARPATVFPSR